MRILRYLLLLAFPLGYGVAGGGSGGAAYLITSTPSPACTVRANGGNGAGGGATGSAGSNGFAVTIIV